MRLLALCGLAVLSGCGGGGTSGTNYSDPPPMAEIVATPTPAESAAAETNAATAAEDTPAEIAPTNDADANAAGAE